MIIMTENLATKIAVNNLDNPSVGTMKLGKTPENMDNVLAKIVQKSIFRTMKLTSLLMKKRPSFSSKICPVF